jgi:2-dehydro-3-deoxyglucarate aldolase
MERGFVMNLKERIKSGAPCIGAWAQSPSVATAEAMASCGFHWLAIDLEHAAIGIEAAAAIFLAAERHGVVPLARLPSADPYLARRLLDNGAQGLIVPVVESAEAFGEFSAHCLYPPRGKRGVGLSRCNLWGDNFADYLANFTPVLVPQIETKKGVAAAPAIAARPEVDALFLGPYDLSADLGKAGDFSTPEFLAARDAVKKACQANGKAAGIHQVDPIAEGLKEKIADGFSFIAYSTDLIALRHALGRPVELL